MRCAWKPIPTGCTNAAGPVQVDGAASLAGEDINAFVGSRDGGKYIKVLRDDQPLIHGVPQQS